MARDRCGQRSHCPISFSLDILGDRWTLLVLRDLILVGKQYFREFLTSPEAIASNILASRLKRLEDLGLLSRRVDPDNARQVIYAPTAKALDLLPTMIELVRWGAHYDPKTDVPREMLRQMENDRDAFIAQVRARHEKKRRKPTRKQAAAS